MSMKLLLLEVFVSNIIVTMVISNKSCCKHVLFMNLSDFISTTTRVTSVKSKKFLFCSFSVAKFGIAPLCFHRQCFRKPWNWVAVHRRLRAIKGLHRADAPCSLTWGGQRDIVFVFLYIFLLKYFCVFAFLYSWVSDFCIFVPSKCIFSAVWVKAGLGDLVHIWNHFPCTAECIVHSS